MKQPLQIIMVYTTQDPNLQKHTQTPLVPENSGSIRTKKAVFNHGNLREYPEGELPATIYWDKNYFPLIVSSWAKSYR